MPKIPTVTVKDGNGYKIINESDFDPKTMERYESPLPRDTVTTLQKTNADGTFDEPTPTDIRFPNKDVTEFANNHGATVNKSAAQMREEKKLPDAPGGLAPDPVLAEAVEKEKAAREAAAAKKAADEKAAAAKK
jgi:hypothetical protein